MTKVLKLKFMKVTNEFYYIEFEELKDESFENIMNEQDNPSHFFS